MFKFTYEMDTSIDEETLAVVAVNLTLKTKKKEKKLCKHVVVMAMPCTFSHFQEDYSVY